MDLLLSPLPVIAGDEEAAPTICGIKLKEGIDDVEPIPLTDTTCTRRSKYNSTSGWHERKQQDHTHTLAARSGRDELSVLQPVKAHYFGHHSLQRRKEDF